MTALGQRLGGGRRAEVFAFGAHVFKAFEPGFPEAAVAREAMAQGLARAKGLPVPMVHGVRLVEGRLGIEMDLAPGPVLAEAMLQGIVAPEAGLARMLRLHRAIHACSGDGLPSLRDRLATRIAAAPLPDTRRQALLARLAMLPPGDRLCHGDFHPFNILGPPGQEQVIDWADAASGPPLADACTACVLIASHAPDLARDYLARYVAAAGADSADAAAWLPLAAAARLAENFPGEHRILLGWVGE
jgi:hypothetical protein